MQCSSNGSYNNDPPSGRHAELPSAIDGDRKCRRAGHGLHPDTGSIRTRPNRFDPNRETNHDGLLRQDLFAVRCKQVILQRSCVHTLPVSFDPRDVSLKMH
jgi:hypothetical protein